MRYIHTVSSIGGAHTGADHQRLPEGVWLLHDPSDPGYEYSLWRYDGGDPDQLLVDWAGRPGDDVNIIDRSDHNEGFNSHFLMFEVRPEDIDGLVMAARHGVWPRAARSYIDKIAVG